MGWSGPSPRPRVFRVLAVCTGNQCRSPATEWMLGQLLAGRRESRFDVESAGTHGPAGMPVHPWTAEALARRGVHAEGHVSRLLTRDVVERADLVLTAERGHRTAVVALAPEAVDRTFTVLEFLRLAGTGLRLAGTGLPLRAPSPGDLVAAVATLRRCSPAAVAGLDELADPVQGGPQEHERMLAVLQRVTVSIADLLRAVAPSALEVRLPGRHTWVG